MQSEIPIEAVLRDGTIAQATITPEELADFHHFGPPATVSTPSGLRQAVAIEVLCPECGFAIPYAWRGRVCPQCSRRQVGVHG